ncbi:MAG: bifunctional glutamate N-acetyltransferase/amino-acid acetyltransferase ArgJ [Planctomycetota bacterium]
MTTEDLPLGFRFSGVACGIKPSGKPDLSLIVCDDPVSAAGVFTQNQIVAAPVLWCRDRTPSSSIRAVVTNSGNANACTGDQGTRDTEAMCDQTATAMGCKADHVLVMSTGIIGHHLPMDRVTSGIENAAGKLGRELQDFHDSADAILTTDIQRKAVVETRSFADKPVRVAAMAKGAGMIAPNMATMLACVTTDATLSPSECKAMLTRIADRSFNRVSVDGHVSTNDTLLMLASGKSQVEFSKSEAAEFEQWLTQICLKLAIELVADGEGAKYVMHVKVDGAASDEAAEQIARAIGASPLVKTAMTGSDPNWGRIVSAAGYAGATVVPEQTSLRLAGVEIYRGGVPTDFDAKQVSQAMQESQIIPIELTVGQGSGKSEHWASDLGVDYVRFNSEYTT